MLQAIRNLFKSWIAIAIFGVLVAVAFLFFGIEGYFSQSNATWVAKVDGQEISQDVFNNALNAYRQQQMNQPGNTMEAADFQKPEVKRMVLDQVINRQLLLNENQELGIKVPDAAVRAQIQTVPAFQVNGKFDPTSYLAVLAQIGKSVPQFEDEIRSDLATQQMPQAIMASAFVTKAEAEAYLHLQLQQRDFSYLTLPPPEPTAQQQHVTGAQISAYYKEHQAEFMVPEQVSVNYIDLDAATMKVTPDLSETALKTRYEKEKNRFVSPPQWQVSHILIKVPPKATDAEKQEALAKAKRIDALAHAPDADFAKLASEYSDDLGSKRQGGSLGWLQKGDVGPAFAAALEKLKAGEVSEPVLTPEGYHIIDVLDMRKGEAESFADVKDQLAQEATKNAHQDTYREVGDKLTNAVLNDPTSLKGAVAKLGDELKRHGIGIQTTPLFGRSGTNTGLAADPKVVRAAFSNTVLVQGYTSDPINLGDNHMVVIHIAKHVAAAPKPLADVSDEIKSKIIAQRVDATAKKLAQAEFAKFKGGTSLDAMAKASDLEVEHKSGVSRNAQGLDPALVKAVFKLEQPAKGGDTKALVPLADGHFALVMLAQVKPGDLSALPDQADTFVRGQMARAYGNVDLNAFLEILRRGSKVEINDTQM